MNPNEIAIRAEASLGPVIQPKSFVGMDTQRCDSTVIPVDVPHKSQNTVGPIRCGARSETAYSEIIAVCDLDRGHEGRHRAVLDFENNRVASWPRVVIHKKERTKPE